jgi:TRAP-type mannitol/chloroaromatic compound transport system substrate-binding protein
MKRLSAQAIALLIIMIGLIAGVFPACSTGAGVQTVKWRMATSWTSDDLLYKNGAVAICQRVARLSGGRFIIEPHPAGELTAALKVHEAVSLGKVECGHSWPGYWREKDPGFMFFSSIPNMMTMQEWAVWLYGPSQGIGLWRELYSKYNMVPFPGALNGPEFGFFTSKPVRTVDDFRGMKIRTVGIGYDVLRELGAVPVMLAQGEIKAAFARGEIDGFEFNTPAVDWNLGFDGSIAPCVTLPSWHQPSCMYDTVVNNDAWQKLPSDLQAIFESACKEVAMVDYLTAIEGANPEYLHRYEKSSMQIFVLDAQSMEKITGITDRLCDDIAAKDAFSAKVLKSQRDFRIDYRTWEKWGDYRIYPSK